MSRSTRSFLKRISQGGPIAGAVSMLLGGGCAVIGDGPEPDSFEITPMAEQVDICHIPPGNSDNSQEITVGQAGSEAQYEQGVAEPTCGTNELPPATILMCHVNSDGTFADVMVDSSTLAARLDAGDTVGTCAALFCGDS
jgi:hypothetical protein